MKGDISYINTLRYFLLLTERVCVTMISILTVEDHLNHILQFNLEEELNRRGFWNIFPIPHGTPKSVNEYVKNYVMGQDIENVVLDIDVYENKLLVLELIRYLKILSGFDLYVIAVGYNRKDVILKHLIEQGVDTNCIFTGSIHSVTKLLASNILKDSEKVALDSEKVALDSALLSEEGESNLPKAEMKTLESNIEALASDRIESVILTEEVKHTSAMEAHAVSEREKNKAKVSSLKEDHKKTPTSPISTSIDDQIHSMLSSMDRHLEETFGNEKGHPEVSIKVKGVDIDDSVVNARVGSTGINDVQEVTLEIKPPIVPRDVKQGK